MAPVTLSSTVRMISPRMRFVEVVDAFPVSSRKNARRFIRFTRTRRLRAYTEGRAWFCVVPLRLSAEKLLTLFVRRCFVLRRLSRPDCGAGLPAWAPPPGMPSAPASEAMLPRGTVTCSRPKPGLARRVRGRPSERERLIASDPPGASVSARAAAASGLVVVRGSEGGARCSGTVASECRGTAAALCPPLSRPALALTSGFSRGGPVSSVPGRGGARSGALRAATIGLASDRSPLSLMAAPAVEPSGRGNPSGSRSAA
mmetsp:Transcript_4980/g.21344  ORF Transcript_4980/g.21344 Transcript_4980/m.21344 type:complete len:258 (-) Transcript_4980:79-852(-)